MSIQPLVDLAREHDGLSTDDVLTSLLPLFGQVVACHERGLVAPLEGVDALDLDEQLLVTFDEARAVCPRRDDRRLAEVQRATTRAFEVTGRAEATADITRGDYDVRSLDVLAPGDEVKSPIFVGGWTTWEHRVGVHDELADIACLGMLLVALAGGLDLADASDIEALAGARKNLFAVAPRLHPVVAAVATRMIDPDRSQRPQDLASLVERLETYRDQPVDFDLRQVAKAGTQDVRKAVLSALRDRLFDLSKRNRLIWFRPSAQSLNLTEASVPLLMDTRNIRPEQLFTWNPKVADKVLSGKPVALGSVVRWEDAPYANGILDTVLSQARRDRQEYGQAQLRLVVAFLRWHDLKGDRGERISSPLLLLPVSLTKQRGVRDSFLLQAESPEAEVNPALRQYLKQLYNLDLPASIDLSRERIADLHAKLQADIRRTEPAVELRLQEKPRIELIHSKALIRLEAFQRRAGAKGSVLLGKRSYAYSYRRRDYRPLGLQVFLDRVVLRPAPFATMLGDVPAARMPSMAPAITVKKDLYHLDDGGSGNPYAWDIDLCSLTIANFNYRTMSLVRDYRDLLGNGTTSASFERLFSLEPRPLPPAEVPDVPLADRYLVLPSDGSQVAAIAHARRGESFVIQGPPGTGKSQTITNLIADYVARGKRVLFVCQKRAAIDVVHARLRQRGLDLLASLIHDSQADKKAFVMGLKETYEDWLADGSSPAAAEARRRAVLDRLAAAVAEIEAYEAGLAAPAGASGPRLREVIERLVDLRDQRWGDQLPPEQRRLVPSAAAWWAARPVVDQVTTALAGAGSDPRLAASPIRFLAPRVLDAVRPEAEVATAAPALAADVRAIAAGLDVAANETGADSLRLSSVEAVAELGVMLLPVARRGRSSVLRRSSAAADELRADVRADRDAETALAKARSDATGWHDPLAPDDARAALAIAEAKEGSFLKFLDGGWRRVKAAVAAGFSTGPRAVPVTATVALRQLVAVYDAEAALESRRTLAEDRWGHRDLAALSAAVDASRKPEDPAIAGWRDRLADADEGDVAAALADARGALARLRSDLAEVLEDVDDVPLGELAATLDHLAEPRQSAAIRAAGPALRALAAHPEVARALRRLPAMPGELEYSVCAATLDEAEAIRPAVARFGGDRLAELVARGQALLPELYEADADVVVARLRARFLDEVAHSQRSVTGMTPTERERKKTWTTGRRELENEFRKVMRYRAIRDLAEGETGAVVAALRPIWLMSPTSVSDTLPLARDLFDVVIYDEASQIPVEEAVPAMHRADQVIVVGDRMQLPPTRFFTASSALADEDEDKLEVGVVLDGDSFLAQSAGRLPSTMLTWHYRSRYESLINFSNAAFYEGRLATIPDRRPQAEALPEIRVDGSDPAVLGDAAAEGVDELLARPISLHRMDGSPYTQRTNPGEAAYIAQLVRELLRRDTGLTIGIVAFSEAQQTEIERQLEALAHADTEFAALYEAELVREDDDQVVGLFVKNLENVQGDERDIILMSVCYGPDRDGRMVMNFGPINQEGGEKRLNVIFSRARDRMAIVSSIDGSAITNTYNDGANTLRRFLEYAAAVSRGDANGSAAVMTSFRDRRAQPPAAASANATASQLAEALRARGHLVVERVGQSGFRVDLAVRRQEDEEHRVAVLLDHAERVGSQPVPERALGHPGVLRATGWRVVHVLTRDWHERPDAAVEAVERALADDPDRDASIAEEVRQELERAATEAVAAPPTYAGFATAPSGTGPFAQPAAPGGRPASPVQQAASDEKLAGRSVCFTGASVCSIGGVRLSRDDQERLALKAGMEVRQSVSSRLDFLVLSHEDSHSTKAQRAAQLGVRRIAEPAFWEMLGVAVDSPATAVTRPTAPSSVGEPASGGGNIDARPAPPVVDRPAERLLWTARLTGGERPLIFPSPTIDAVYVGDAWGPIFRAFALADGRELGKARSGTTIRAVVHSPDGDLLAASGSRLHRYSAPTLLERSRWETRVPKYANSIAIAGDLVVMAEGFGDKVAFVNLADGTVRRRVTGTSSRLVSADDGPLLIASKTGAVSRIDIVRSKITPFFQAVSSVSATAAFGYLWLLEGDSEARKPSSRLRQFSLLNGAAAGGTELGAAVDHLAAGHLGVFGFSDGQLLWVAGADGQPNGRLWQAQAGERWVGVDADRGIAFAANSPDWGPNGRTASTLYCRGLGL